MGYPGNYVADDSYGEDPCSPYYRGADFDGENIENCVLCGEVIEIGDRMEIEGMPVDSDCYNNDIPMEEKIRMIKKLKR